MKIISHKANDNTHKENSLEAVLNSLKSPYTDGIEIDVRLTKDNKLILNHDPFYKGYYINHTKAKTLTKQGLNTLDEVLKQINSNKIIMIEVKLKDKNIKKTAKTLLKTINKYNLNYYICSFNYNFIKYLTKTKYKIGLIISPKINEKHIKNNFDFNSISTLLNKKSTKETFKWTVNTKNDLKKVNKTDNIITDNPKKIYNLIKES